MNRISKTFQWVAIGVLGVTLAGGCSNTQSVSAADKKRFGYVGMSMPPEALKELAQQHPTAPTANK